MNLDELIKTLGIEIDPELLTLALTHSSYGYEHNTPDYERLEFLGDSVLGYLVASFVFEQHPELQEGELTKLKNAVVSGQALAAAANRMDLGSHLRIGKGEEQTDGRKKVNILADAFESVLGAAFLSNGLDAAKHIVEKFIFPLLDDPDAVREASDPKTSLVEILARLGREDVTYMISGAGPEHERIYTAKCHSGDELLGVGTGKTKKSAETDAAINSLRAMQKN
ncbi:MAG: ribonuclease III [Aquiluna sp.]|nr:ribonuclease III [Aquiluna sp.]